MTSVDSARAAAEQAVSQFGQVDILVNNAGVAGSHVAASHLTLEDWDACYEV